MRRSSRPPRSATRARGAPRRNAATPAPRVVRIHMHSRRSAVPPTVERILDAAKDAGLDLDQSDDLAVALAEALSNAAVHGNRLREGSQVRITVEVTPRKGLAVEIQDSGPGFDRSSLADPTHPAHLLLPGGRGVFLMGRLVDHLEYNTAGNRVRLVMKRRRRPSQAGG